MYEKDKVAVIGRPFRNSGMLNSLQYVNPGVRIDKRIAIDQRREKKQERGYCELYRDATRTSWANGRLVQRIIGECRSRSHGRKTTPDYNPSRSVSIPGTGCEWSGGNWG